MSKSKSPLILGTENVRKLLTHYAVPAIIGMTATSLYNIIDSIFIGQGIETLAISGLAVTFPFMNLAAAFGSLVGVGASTIISVKMGQKDMNGAENALGNVVLLNLIIGSIFMVLSLSFLEPLLYFFGASDATLSYARDYMQIILYGNLITHVFMGLNDVMRASGYPARAMIITLLAVASNAVFNSIFIFGLGLGIRGAAIGTICAQSLALGAQMIHYTRSNSILRFQRGIFTLRRNIVNGILGIGLSPFSINLCACLVVLFINKGLRDFGGDLYVGAYGISNRIIFLFIMIVMGLNQGMQPIAGYNYGAKLYSRVFAVLKYTILCGCCVTTLGWIICELFPTPVIRMFTPDDYLIELTRHGLRIMVLVFPFVGFQMVTVGFFQSIGIAKKSIFLALTRQLLFLVPMLAILPHYYGTDGVWFCFPIADMLSCIIAAILFFHELHKLKNLQ